MIQVSQVPCLQQSILKRDQRLHKLVWPHPETINNEPTGYKSHSSGNSLCSQCITVAPKKMVFWWPSGYMKYLGTAEKFNQSTIDSFLKCYTRTRRRTSLVTRIPLWEQDSLPIRLFRGNLLLVRTCKRSLWTKVIPLILELSKD